MGRPVRRPFFIQPEGFAVTEKNQREQHILEQLRSQFPGAVAVTPGTALEVSGLTAARDVHAAARQAIHRGTFPFETSRLNKRRVVLIVELARVLSEAEPSV